MKTESQPKLDALELARIRKSLSRSVEMHRESGDDMDACSWGMEYGILVWANDAQRISDAIHALFEFLSNPVFAQAPAMYAALAKFEDRFRKQAESYMRECSITDEEAEEVLSILAAARGEANQSNQ